jgi:hypothetical protein
MAEVVYGDPVDLRRMAADMQLSAQPPLPCVLRLVLFATTHRAVILTAR